MKPCTKCGSATNAHREIKGKGQHPWCRDCERAGDKERKLFSRYGDAKPCTKCGSATSSHRLLLGVGRYHPWCRECERESVRNRRLAKPNDLEHPLFKCLKCGQWKRFKSFGTRITGALNRTRQSWCSKCRDVAGRESRAK